MARTAVRLSGCRERGPQHRSGQLPTAASEGRGRAATDEEFIDTGKQWTLERKADRLLKRTGVKGDAMLTRKDLSERPQR